MAYKINNLKILITTPEIEIYRFLFQNVSYKKNWLVENI